MLRRHRALIDELLSATYRSASSASSPDPRGVTLLELRAELSDVKRVYPSYGDDDLGRYLSETFGILAPLDGHGRQPSKPFALRSTGTSTDQLLTLLALVFDWVYVETDKLFYRTQGIGLVRGRVGSDALRVVGVGPNGQQIETVSAMKRAMQRSTFSFALLINGRPRDARPHQTSALRCFLEGWWRTTGQIAYNDTHRQQLLLIRKYDLQDEDYERCPHGTGVYCTTTLECIEDPRDVFTHKMTDGRIFHYNRASIEAWVRTRRHDPTWPNTGERMDPSVAARILGETPARPRRSDDIHCCWEGYRVVLTRAQVRGSSWQIRLPYGHYSAGFVSRVGGWDWNAAQDVQNAPPDVLARWEREVVTFDDDDDDASRPARRRRVNPTPVAPTPPAPTPPPSNPDIVVHKVAAWTAGEVPSAAVTTTPIAIFTPDAVTTAFYGVLGPILHGKTVYNAYTDTVTRIDSTALTPSHLQVLARNEVANVTGIIDDAQFYPGLPDINRFLAVRILRCLVKCSIVASIVECHHYGGYGAPQHARAGQIILIDQSGFQWQRDHFNTGGIFFYPTTSPADFDEWRQTCYRAFFEQDPPSSPSTPMEVTWLGLTGRMCEEQLKRGFRLEFVQAFECANQMARAADRVAYFRFLKAGLGFFCENLDMTTKARLPSLRLQGIAQALEAMDHGAENRVRILELPFSNGDAGAMTRIEGACALLGIDFRGGRIVDALAPIEDDAILAVTNCADPHAAIGNEGGYSSVDAAIATNTHSEHMVVAARMPQMQTSATNVVYRALPTIPAETVLIPSALASRIYQRVTSIYGVASPQVTTMQSKNNSDGIVGSKMQFAMQVLGFGDGVLRYAHDGYTISNLPSALHDDLLHILQLA